MILRGLIPAILLNLAILVAPAAILGRFPDRDPVVWAFLAIATFMVLADAPTIGRHPTNGDRDCDRFARALALATGVLMLATFWASLLERSTRSDPALGPLNLAGGFLMLLGVALRASAVRSLGDHFVTEPGDGPLIERGIHARIRHPSEAGNLATCLGAALLLGSLAGLAITWLALIPLVISRIRLEDRDLHDRFGERFDRYAERVGAIVPRWRVASSAGGSTVRAAAPGAGSSETGACGPAIRGAGWGD